MDWARRRQLFVAFAALLIVALGVLLLVPFGDERDDGSTGAVDETVAASGALEARRETPAPEEPTELVEATPEAREPIPPERAITGRVIDELGRGIAGASVLAFDAVEPARERRVREPGETPPVATTVSTGDGAFAIEVEPRRVHRLAARAPGRYAVERGRADRDWTPHVAGESGVFLVLARSPRLAGVVQDTEGRPIAGATVALRGVEQLEVLDERTLTDDEGRYRHDADLLLYSRPVKLPHLFVSAKGFADALIALDVLLEASPDPERPVSIRRDVVLERGGTVVGRVVDAATAEPISGCEVRLWSHEGRDVLSWPGGSGDVPSPFGPTVVARTRTDEQGRYRLSGVPTRLHSASALGAVRSPWGSVQAVHEGFAWGGAGVARSEEEGGVQELDDLVLQRAAHLSGSVLRGAEPIADARIGIVVRDFDVHAIEANGVGLFGFFDEKIYWTAGQRGYARALTDASGRFEGPPIPCDLDRPTAVELLVMVHGERFTETIELRAGEHHVARLSYPEAPRGAEYVLHVRDEEGKPLVGVRGDSGDDRVGRSFSDGEGRMRFLVDGDRGAPAADLEAIFSKRGYQSVRHRLVPDAAAEPIEIVLPIGHVVAGRVVDDDGRPAHPALLALEDGGVAPADVLPSHRWGYAHADHLGRFRIEDVPEGPYRLTVDLQAPGLEELVVERVPTGATDLELVLPYRLPERRDVEVLVEPAHAGDLWVTLRLRGDRQRARDEGPGRRAFLGVPVGLADLEVRARGLALERQRFEILAGEGRQRVVVKMVPGGAARVMVRGMATLHRDWHHPLLLVLTGPGGLSRIEQAGDDARTIDGLQPGEWTCDLRIAEDPASSMLPAPVALRIDAGATAEIELELPGTALVRARLPIVRPEDGDIRPFAQDAVGDAHQAWWNQHSTFSSRASAWRVAFTPDEGRRLLAPVKLTSLQLQPGEVLIPVSALVPARPGLIELVGPDGVMASKRIAPAPGDEITLE